MKKCPVCGSIAFDDATVCFGCMFRYSGQAPKHQSDAVKGESPTTVKVPLVLAASDGPAAGGPERGKVAAGGPERGVPAANEPERAARQRVQDVSPSFAIRLTPDINQSGTMTWNCAVELVPA